MREARDYTSCIDTPETEHAIPVLGLFDGCINNILLELLDENKNVISQKTIKITCTKETCTQHRYKKKGTAFQQKFYICNRRIQRSKLCV